MKQRKKEIESDYGPIGRDKVRDNLLYKVSFINLRDNNRLYIEHALTRVLWACLVPKRFWAKVFGSVYNTN